MSALITEEKAYCDNGNYKHLAQILTSIALYEVLQNHGKIEAEAYKMLALYGYKLFDILYVPRGFFTPPFETLESLRSRLYGLYTKVQVEHVEGIGCFRCVKG